MLMLVTRLMVHKLIDLHSRLVFNFENQSAISISGGDFI